MSPSGTTRTGSVSKVEIATPIDLIYKVLFPSISTFATPPRKRPRRCRPAGGQKEGFCSLHYKMPHEVFGVSVELRARVSRKRAFFWCRSSTQFSPGVDHQKTHAIINIRL